MTKEMINLKRRSQYKSPYKLFGALNSWALGLSLTEYPLYLLSTLIVKLKNPYSTSLHYLPMMIVNNVIKLVMKALFIYMVVKFAIPEIDNVLGL